MPLLFERDRKDRKLLSHDFFKTPLDPIGEFAADDWEYKLKVDEVNGGVDGPESVSS